MSKHLKLSGLLIVITGFNSPIILQAESLVTHYFEGEVNDSTSSHVAVGDRITGTFTYDLDWDDRAADDPNWFFHLHPPGFSIEEYPEGSPIGMSFTVGSLSHRTSMVFELTVDNDNSDDYMYIGSDNLAPTPPLGGYIDLVDSTRSAFSSDLPPAILDLSAFTDITFWGSDGQGGSFLATLDLLRVVPEPATLMLVLIGQAVYGALRFDRCARHRRRTSLVLVALLAVTFVAPLVRSNCTRKRSPFPASQLPTAMGRSLLFRVRT